MNPPGHESALASEGTQEFHTPCRSPHPYHRRGRSLIVALKQGGSDDRSRQSSTSNTKSSSESGTEADDEAGRSLKRLPAPPLRQHKGLRGGTPDPTLDTSPLPTPTGEDDRSRLFGSFSFPSRSETTREKQNEEQRRIRERYTRRRRAEIVRRGTEAILFYLVGMVVCWRNGVLDLLRDWHQGMPVMSRLQSRLILAELASFIAVPVTLYASYPLRLLIRSRNSRRRRIRIPSSFDPATLIYPVFLPFLVAISIPSGNVAFLLPNMILGLASVPASCIPVFELVFSFSHIQWLISIIPLVLSQNSLSKQHPSRPLGLKLPAGTGMDPEILVLLYPLHANLVPTLKYLTTTSLDESELQLLSTILFNLLLLSSSPQMEILKSLLWVGGIALFCLCSRVLQWEVTLARLPLWRLRRNEWARDLNQSPLAALDMKICHRLVNPTSVLKAGDSSDEETYKPLARTRTSDRSVRATSIFPNNPFLKDKKDQVVEPTSAIEPPSWLQNAGESGFQHSKARRHTLGSIADTVNAIKAINRWKTSSGRLRKLPSPSLQPFLSFTPAQAIVRKWLYALYAYLVTLLVILVPVRHYVGTKALNGSEPFGWAVGYLAGNIPAVRFSIVSYSLENWIKLPPLKDEADQMFCELGILERLRKDIGEANTRLVIAGYCLCVLTTGISIVLHLSTLVEVDTRRKVFHGIMVAMFLPTIYIDPCFTALAFGLILSIFLLLDLFRASQLPPISRPLTYFLSPYVDGRDHRGPVIVSHIFLLIGCAIPLWLSIAGSPRSSSNSDGPWFGWDLPTRDVSMLSGVICVGLGDAAASLIGRRLGRHRWYWGGGKSLEGSLAFVIAVTSGLLFAYSWLVLGGWRREAAHYNADDGNNDYVYSDNNTQPWITVVLKCVVAASGASLTEAVLTGANDNVVVPVVLWLLVRGLEI